MAYTFFAPILTIVLLHLLPVFPAEFEVGLDGDADVDGVHDGVVALGVVESEYVTYFMHGHLQKVDAAAAHCAVVL